MRKKQIITTLLITLLGVSLIGCGGTEKSEKNEKNNKSEVVKSENDKLDESNKEDDKADVEIEEFKTNATIKETILYDENNVKITATKLWYEDDYAYLDVVLENNSDITLTFLCGATGYSTNAVNGYTISDGYICADVEAGQVVNESVRFDINGLTMYGIMEIADIQIGFQMEDDDYNRFATGPKKIVTTVADSYDYDTDTYIEYVKSGAFEKITEYSIDQFVEGKFFEQADIEVISAVIATNEDDEKILMIEMKNNSSEVYYAEVIDVQINGLKVYNFSWESNFIVPETRYVMATEISRFFDELYWDEYGINEVGELAFTISLQDSNWEEVMEYQPVIIEFSEDGNYDIDGTEVYNSNDIKIVSKGLIQDESKDYPKMDLLFAVENEYADEVTMFDLDDSLLINGIEMDYSYSYMEVDEGEKGVMVIEVDDESLEENDISSIDDIKNAEITFEIKSGYDEVDTPNIKVEY